MGTRGYVYNQICVCIHIIMDSQIPFIILVDTCLTTRPVPMTDITHRYPWTWVFLPPLVSTSTLRVTEQFQYGSIICGEIELKNVCWSALFEPYIFVFILKHYIFVEGFKNVAITCLFECNS